MRPTSSVPKIPLLSPFEFRIFALLARESQPLTIRDIGQKLARQDPNFSQTYNAIGTLLQRMARKGYVAQKLQQDKAKLYSALLPYDMVLQQQIDTFLDSLLLTTPQELRMVIETALARLVPARAAET